MTLRLLLRFYRLKIMQLVVFDQGHKVHLKRNRHGVLRIEHVEPSGTGHVRRGGEKVPVYFRWYDGEEFTNLRVTNKNGEDI